MVIPLSQVIANRIEKQPLTDHFHMPETARCDHGKRILKRRVGNCEVCDKNKFRNDNFRFAKGHKMVGNMRRIFKT